ncbi:MAG: sterol desaturase family protein [Verrucomicrobia subdivision 3 bacterium]|nr:sterol desaturase family protein [Limisphaerales bacterium]
MTGLNPFEVIVLLLLAGLFLWEFRDRHFRQSWYRHKQRLRRNLSFAAASVFVMALLKGANALLQGVFAPQWLRVWFPVELIVCFLAAEFLGWMLHFVKHRNSFLWKFHFQHHRESQYNLWLTAHTHGLEVILSGVVMAAALLLLGFSLMAIEIYLAFYALMKFFQHSAHSYSLSVLDKIFITPAYHRLHHEVNSRCNYGITLTLFDLLFRTLRWPAASQPELKLGMPPESELPYGFWKEMIHFYSSHKKQIDSESRQHDPVRTPDSAGHIEKSAGAIEFINAPRT